MFERVRSFVYSVTGEETAVRGLWERVGDDFAGCLILVEDADQRLQGRITYVPPLMRHYGWRVGDIKWRNMAPRRAASFGVEDLAKEIDPDTHHVRRESYQQATLYFLGTDEFAVITHGQGRRNSRWRRSAKVSLDPANAGNS